MNGRPIMAAMLVFTVLFGAALWYFQVYAYYVEVTGLPTLRVQDREIAVTDYTGIDSESSGLKRRGCFITDPGAFTALEPMDKPTPLKAPNWFECFDYVALTLDLEAGNAKAFLAVVNEKDGIDRVVAIYPDGRGFEWRQLNDQYAGN